MAAFFALRRRGPLKSDQRVRSQLLCIINIAVLYKSKIICSCKNTLLFSLLFILFIYMQSLCCLYAPVSVCMFACCSFICSFVIWLTLFFFVFLCSLLYSFVYLLAILSFVHWFSQSFIPFLICSLNIEPSISLSIQCFYYLPFICKRSLHYSKFIKIFVQKSIVRGFHS